MDGDVNPAWNISVWDFACLVNWNLLLWFLLCFYFGKHFNFSEIVKCIF